MRSKKELLEIIKIFNEFYELNDIEINRKKSELLVINHKQTRSDSNSDFAIRVGNNKDIVYIKREVKAIKYLGVWILEKGGNECNVKIITREVLKICKAIRFKRVLASQLIY